ncbi:high nitrogen upregulated cytochrome P450 monooxygenase 2 [Daedaleopsis nitida]|nr:high nitrogen upregulated cytochrome P450 monooxygenase 2 [Daedaleopsis nitida]
MPSNQDSSLSNSQSVAILVLAALFTHQILRRLESYYFRTHACFLLLPPSLLALVDARSSLSSFPSLAFYYGTYLAALAFSVVAYRLSPFHPLARYPGPLLCRTTMFWNACKTLNGRQHKYYQALHERYGNVVRIGPNLLTIRDPTLISPLLGTSGVPKGNNFVGSLLTENVPMIGIMDTEEHLRRRRAWNRGLGPSALKEYQHLIAIRVHQLVSRLEEQEGEVALGQWINYWSYDLMCDMAFGGGTELLRDGDEKNVWGIIEEGVIPATFLGYLPWLGLLLAHIPAAVKPLNEFIQLGQRFTTQRLERGSTKHDLFHYLHNEDLHGKSPPPERQLVDDGILAIVAGADTVSSALTSILFCLLTHPDVYARLQAEVDATYLPGEDPLANPKRAREMPYLHAVIKESMRLFPPVMTASQRKVPRDSAGVHAGSLYLPPGTSIIIPPYAMHRDRKNFSWPDAFWPARWLVAAGKLPLGDAPPPRSLCEQRDEGGGQESIVDGSRFVHNKGAFMAFYHGPMGCVGKGLAMVEMRAVLCALLHRFEIRFAGSGSEGGDTLVQEHEYERAYKDYFVATRPAVRVVLTKRE